MLAQRIVYGDKRLALAPAMGSRLLEHNLDAAVINHALPPVGLREKAREVRFVGALKDAAGHVSHAETKAAQKFLIH
jgi:hypothetical protein